MKKIQVFFSDKVFRVKVKLELQLNPFFPNPPFLYPLETSENRKVFWYFQGPDKGCIRNERVSFLKNLGQFCACLLKLSTSDMSYIILLILLIKIKLTFYFHTYLWCRKRLYEGL